MSKNIFECIFYGFTENEETLSFCTSLTLERPEDEMRKNKLFSVKVLRKYKEREFVLRVRISNKKTIYQTLLTPHEYYENNKWELGPTNDLPRKVMETYIKSLKR